MGEEEEGFRSEEAGGDVSSTMTPLSLIAAAFEELAKLLNNSKRNRRCRPENVDFRLDVFCDACSLVSVLFSCLGLAFKFAEMEYVSKVH